MVLYQKYRPKTFKGVVNQEPVKKSLISAIKSDQVAHAYIFSGPRGTGKTTIARILSRAMNCQDSKDGQPCLSCSSCQDQGSVDVIEIDAASNRKIDDIRALREKIKFSPIAGKYKIYIVDEVHMLTKEAFNALLKILEEPPKHAIFILATTEPERVPDTVLSRCQRFDFKPISIAKMANYLAKVAKKEGVKIDKQALLMIASSSGGSLRDALGILEQISVGLDKKIGPEQVRDILGLVEHRAIVSLVDQLIGSKEKEAIQLADNLISQGITYTRIVDSILEYLRDLLVISLGSAKSTNLTDIQLKKAQNQAEKLGRERISAWMERVIASKEQNFDNLPQLPLELLVVDLINLGEGDSKEVEEVKPKNELDEEPEERSGPSKKKAEKETQPVSEESKTEVARLSSKDKELIEGSWQKIVDELKQHNHSLSAILSHSKLEKVDQSKIVLTVEKRFYQKRILDVNNRRKIQSVVKKIAGKSCSIDCRIGKSTNKNRGPDQIDKLTKKAEEIF